MMANNLPAVAQPKPARHVSLTISVTVPDIEQTQAMELANQIQDIAEEFGARVLASYGQATANPFGG